MMDVIEYFNRLPELVKVLTIVSAGGTGIWGILKSGQLFAAKKNAETERHNSATTTEKITQKVTEISFDTLEKLNDNLQRRLDETEEKHAQKVEELEDKIDQLKDSIQEMRVQMQQREEFTSALRGELEKFKYENDGLRKSCTELTLERKRLQRELDSYPIRIRTKEIKKNTAAQITLDALKATLTISGHSGMSNVEVEEVFSMLTAIVTSFFSHEQNSTLNIVFALEYYNTMTSRHVREFLSFLETVQNNSKGTAHPKTIHATWQYTENDIDRKEDGEGFAQDLTFPFELEELPEKESMQLS